MSRVLWGVVGAGWIARDHVVPALRSHPDAELVGVVDPVPGRAATLAGPDAAAHLALDGLLAGDGLDVVHVATPNDTHASVVDACLRAGVHVVCEKPLTTTGADAGRLAGVADRANRHLLTGFDQRHHPAHVAAAELVRAGRLGTVVQVGVTYACWVDAGWSSDNWRIDHARSGGGAVIDLAPHVVDLVATVLGRRWDDLDVRLQRAVHGYGVDDGGVLTGRLGEVLVVAQVAYCWPERLPRRRLEVVGTAGSLTATDTMGQVPGGRLVFRAAADGRTCEVPFDRGGDPFRAQVAWVHEVLAGRVDAHPAADAHHHRLLLDALAAAEVRQEARCR